MGNFLDYVNNQNKTKSTKKGRFGNYVTEQKIGFDTFESDLNAASELVNKIYGGWHSADDMKSSYDTVSSMRERLDAHRRYTNDNVNGQDLTKYNESMDKLIKAYDTALTDWDALSAEYAKYADADAYGVAKKNAERYNKYKGLDFAGVRKAMEENPDDAEFLSKYGLNVGYKNKDDVEHELNMVDYLIETTSGEEKKAWKEYRNRLYEATMVNPNALFKGSEAFADGYQPGDLLDALGATAADAFLRGTKGFLGSMEGLADLGAYGVSKAAGFFGLDGVEDSLKNFAQKNMTQDLYRPLYSTSINEDSFLGGLGHSVGEGVGQMGFNLMTGKMGAGIGKNGAGIASKAGMFASSAGSGMSEAYNSGATDMEALAYGLMSGTVETGSEMMFGGLGKSVNALGLSRGIAGLDDQFARKVGSKINNFVLRNAAEMGIKATGEGVEEVVAGLGSAVAKKLTYMSDEDLGKLIEDEDLLNQFLVGTLSSTVTQTPSLMRSYKYGTDFVTDRTDAEEFYITSEYEARLAEAEKDGKMLSNSEKDKLYRQVEKDLTTAQEEAYNAAKRNAPNAVGRMASVDVTDTVDNETGSKIKVQGIRTDESGNTVLKTSMGERNLDSVTLNRRDAELVAMAEEMEESRADLFVSMYNGQDATQYKDSFDMAYAYGKNAFGVENAIKRHGVLTESQALQVYKLGVSERTAAPQKKADAITEKYFSDGGKILEGTFDDSAVHYEKLNSRQKASISFLKMLSKATGMNVKIFESTVDKDGNREAKQGYYEPSTNTIHIDAYAGMDKDLFDDAIIPVMSHEVTHWMQYKAPDAYAKMSGIIMDTLSREFGVSPERLVALEKKRLEEKGHDDVTDEYAQDEIIARACEDMLSGNRTVGEIIENMDEQTAKTFSEKFKEVVSKIRAWIKDLLKTYKSNSEEAKILRKYDDKLAELQKAWDEGFAQAIRTNQAVASNKTTGTRYSYSSIANSFFGKEKMSTDDFLSGDYKKTEGYKAYVEQCVNNMRQTRDNFNEAEARAEVEKSIAGIVDVAIAAKKAGYDILDDSEKRNKKDSKNRLLFSSLEPNSDYFTSSDISTICDKRQNFAEIYEDIVRAEEKLGVPEDKRFFNNVDNYFVIHQILAEKGLTQPCRQCYVESMRKNLTPMANAFLKLIRETNPNNKYNDQLFHQSGKNKGEIKSNNAVLRERVLEQLEAYGMSVGKINLKTLTTEEGLAQLKIQAPLIYEAFNSFYGQSKPKMPKAATPFRFGELVALLTDNHGKVNAKLVRKINHTGGFRLQSYSDFQIKNFVDVLQVIFEAGTLGLNGHAYTKVPAFLDATENTNLKRNISIFMYMDGGEWKLDRNDSFPYALEDIYDIVNSDKSGNTSIIAVSQNEVMSAWIMGNDNVGYGIPFHKSGLKMGVVRDTIVKDGDRLIKGYSKTKDHTKQQTEVWAKTHGDNKALTKVKKAVDIYEFWDFENKGKLSKKDLIKKNLEAYIDVCENMGYLPKFREYVMNNSKVLSDVLKYAKELGFASADATIDDISFKYKGYQIPYGYYKFLGDFGMFTPDGNASPQQILSLKDYKFDKAVKFFEDGETLRRNELLQQFSNGEKREEYREGNLSTEELKNIIDSKRTEVVNKVISGRKYSTRDSEGNGLTKEQVEFFKDSKIRDENGNLKVMYHGTSEDFTVFNPFLSGGKNGIAEGYGIYFADTDEVSKVYGGKLMKGYLNITKPATSDKKTIKRTDLEKLIKATCEDEAKRYVEDGSYDNVSDAIKDTWISNYVYTYDIPISKAYRDVADSILSVNDSDMDIVQEVMVGLAIRDYKSAYHFYDILKETLGIDGFVTEWENRNISGGKAQIALAFDSNQFKNIDNTNPTSNPDVRYSERVSNSELAERDDTALYIKNTKNADYIGMIFNGTKTEETRSRRTLDAFIGKDFYVTDGKYVYGSIVLGKPHKYTAEEFHKKENQKKHRVPVGDEYDVKPGGFKWAYPIMSYEKFDTPKKLSDSKEYQNSFQARQVQYSERDIDSWLDALDIDDILDDITGYFFKDSDEKARAPRRVDEVNKRLKAIGLSFNGTKSLAWTDERIEKYLGGGWYGSSNPDYAQAYIAYVTPQQFLNLTVGGKNTTLDMIERESEEYGEVDITKLGDSSPLFLDIHEGKNKAEVTGHEGRHRMYLLGKAGFEKVPVLLFDYRTKYDKTAKDSLKLTAQRYNDTDFISKSRDVVLNDVIPFSNGNKDLIIKKFGSGAEADIRYSERQEESIYDAVGELKRLQKENEALKKDIERLKQFNRLERTVTGGILPKDSQIKSVAAFILKNANSKYDKNLFADELREIYSYMQSEDVEWHIAMSKMLDVARSVVEAAEGRKIQNDYAKFILSTIRGTKVSFNDTQKAEAENAFGKNWNRNYFGWVTVANDGVPLESVWSEWSNQFPDVFSADISDADMATALVDIYDSTRTASELVEEYDKTEMARDIAFEMYNQLWNVTPLQTLADKHSKEVKRLKFEHRQEMKELREKTVKQVFETRWHYSKLIHDVREARDEKIAQLKKESREYTKQYREKIERRNQISQITKKSLKLNTWLKKNSKDEHIVEELKAPVAAVLKALDFSSESFLGTGVPTQKDISLKKAFAHLHDSLDEIYKRQGEENYTIDMPVDYVEFVKGIKDQVDGIVEKVGDNEYVLRDMTLEQLQDMNKMLSVLTHIVTSANKALADANGKAISSMAQSTMVYADDLGEKSKKVGDISDFFNFDNGLPVYVFKMFGEGGRHIFRNLQDGWDKMAFHVKQIIDYSKGSYDAKEVKEWSKDVHEFTFSDGSNVKMTTAQIMSLYCLQKREQARLHLLRGGMRVADFKIGTNTISNEDGALMLPHEIDEVVSTLTDRQKQVADSLQKFMNTVCSDWGNEVSMKRFGIKSFGEENYFPIQSDASVLTGDDTPKTDRGSDVFRLLNMDFTKALNPHANNRIMVDNIFDVFATHTSDMAKYNALALPVLDMFRWYNYKESYRINPEDPEDTRMRAKSLKQSLKKAYGEGSTKYIMQFMKDLNGAHSGGMSNLEKVGRKMISNYKVAAVGANLRVALLQPTSYVRASAVMDPKYLTAALAHKPQIQKAKDTCGIALWKSLGFYDTNISRGVTALIKHDNGWYQKAKEISMKLAEWGDAMTWGYLYNACEAEIKDTQPGLTGAAKDKAVADRLRDVIYATQVVDSTMTRTQNMRNPSTMNQIMTSFMSEPSLSYNLLHDLYIQYNADKRQYGKGAAFKKNGKRIARVSASYIITLCCASLVGGVMDTLRDDDDDEEFVDALIANATENALSDAISMLPLVKDVVSIYKGFNVGRMDMQGIQSSYYAFRKLYKAVMEGEWDYKTVYSVVQSVGKAASQIGGLPVSNLWREFTTIWNNTIGEMYESLKLK